MAYAYPNSGDAAGGSHTSLGIHSSPVKSTLSRKGSEERFDVLHEFKVSIVFLGGLMEAVLVCSAPSFCPPSIIRPKGERAAC